MTIKEIKEVLDLVNNLPNEAKENGIVWLKKLIDNESSKVGGGELKEPLSKKNVENLEKSFKRNHTKTKTTFKKAYYASNKKPYVILKNDNVYCGFSTGLARDKSWEIGKKTNWNRARMYSLPECVEYEDGRYVLYIPGSDKAIISVVHLSAIKSSIKWMKEAKKVVGNTLVFPNYYNVCPIHTETYLGWKYEYHEHGKSISLRARTLKELEEKVKEKGMHFIKLDGGMKVNLNDYVIKEGRLN